MALAKLRYHARWYVGCYSGGIFLSQIGHVIRRLIHLPGMSQPLEDFPESATKETINGKAAGLLEDVRNHALSESLEALRLLLNCPFL